MKLTTERVGNWASQPAPGYLNRLVLIDIEQVESIDLPYGVDPDFTLPISCIKFKPEAVIYIFSFPAKEASLNESQGEGEDGSSYSPAISMRIPRNHPKLSAWINKHQGKRWLVCWRERSGLYGMAGEPGNGMALATSRSVTDQNTTLFTFSSRFAHPYYYISSLPSQNPGSAFSSAFSFAFGGN
ncbi:hypothetical protein BWI97_07135 [Siphonobacter sp. BAB-5405]|uniref:hypothetical protein n=1 Tax=Siphonobacter sp. BAB-5405 TaxID=1864825 RepID=UPI000C7F9A02|nr:hypothetical protein [Siphonobacter sp. BAB-5405]PMD97396.1 hypothetical protein BWI97_07135 [Siphonobacter sp. BAB-5405]